MKLYEYPRSFTDIGPNLLHSIFWNFFFSITTRPIEAKFHVELPWDEGTKACSNDPSKQDQDGCHALICENL